jgi:hypothetical protein
MPPRTRKSPPIAKPAEGVKRLTVPIPVSLHRLIKSACAARGVKMADAVRELLEQVEWGKAP